MPGSGAVPEGEEDETAFNSKFFEDRPLTLTFSSLNGLIHLTYIRKDAYDAAMRAVDVLTQEVALAHPQMPSTVLDALKEVERLTADLTDAPLQETEPDE